MKAYVFYVEVIDVDLGHAIFLCNIMFATENGLEI